MQASQGSALESGSRGHCDQSLFNPKGSASLDPKPYLIIRPEKRTLAAVRYFAIDKMYPRLLADFFFSLHPCFGLSGAFCKSFIFSNPIDASMAAIGSLVFCLSCGNLLPVSKGTEKNILLCECCGAENKGQQSSLVLLRPAQWLTTKQTLAHRRS